MCACSNKRNVGIPSAVAATAGGGETSARTGCDTLRTDARAEGTLLLPSDCALLLSHIQGGLEGLQRCEGEHIQ